MSRDNKIPPPGETEADDDGEEEEATICDFDDDANSPFIKEKVYYAAKDGLSIALLALLSGVKSEAARNAIINQVSITW